MPKCELYLFHSLCYIFKYARKIVLVPIVLVLYVLFSYLTKHAFLAHTLAQFVDK